VLYAGQNVVVLTLNRHLARLAQRFLEFFGVPAHASRATVSVRGFAVEIKNNCNAIYEIGLYAAAVWAYPASLRQRISGTLLGAGVLYLVNAVRILSLIAIGAYAREWFEAGHLYAWQVLFLAVVATCWLGWALRVRRLA
jgi:exosortase H (IPTLxxWG-CTERM-specific)